MLSVIDLDLAMAEVVDEGSGGVASGWEGVVLVSVRSSGADSHQAMRMGTECGCV